MFDLSIRGADSMGAAGQRLRRVGRGDLRRAMLSGIQRGTAQARTDVPASWAARMPHRGGLSAHHLTVQTKTILSGLGGHTVGVVIETSSDDRYDLQRMDKGQLWHPVYGHRGAWVDEAVTPGVITDPLKALEPKVRREIVRAIEQAGGRAAG